MTLPPAVLWIDPGKATGLALYIRHMRQFTVREEAFISAGNLIESVCRAWGPQLWVGWEQFTIFPGTPAADAHHAIEMIGVSRRLAMQNRCLILPAAAPSDRNVATMRLLKELGWWVPNRDDAQSAAQHCLSWMMRSGNLPDDVAVRLAALRD